MSEPMTEQEFVALLSPGYRGLDSDGQSESDFDEGWNEATDECAKRVRKYFSEIEHLQSESLQSTPSLKGKI